MIIRFPDGQYAGTTDNQLVSFIDFAPTLLSLTGEESKEYMQGQAFLGKHKADGRKYIHAAADRFDGFTDAIRAVRDNQYKYIRNYRPEQGYYLPVAYRERIPTMQELLRLKDEGKLTDAQIQWFREQKPKEELFDCKADPFELNNLADNPDYKEKLNELSSEMDRWLNEIDDIPNLDERKLVDRLWSGNDSKPKTSEPILTSQNGKVSVTCETEGASIGYKIIKDGKTPKSWMAYQNPIELSEGEKIHVQAHRIGFVPSETVTFNL